MADKIALYHLPSHYVWKFLLKNRISFCVLVMSIIIASISVLGYLIMPNKTHYANQGAIEIRKQGPMFRVKMLKIRKNSDIESSSFFRQILYGKENPYTLIPVSGNIEVKNDSVYFTVYPGRERKVLVESLLNSSKALYVGTAHKMGKWYRTNHIVDVDSIHYLDIEGKICSIHRKDLESVFIK